MSYIRKVKIYEGEKDGQKGYFFESIAITKTNFLRFSVELDEIVDILDEMLRWEKTTEKLVEIETHLVDYVVKYSMYWNKDKASAGTIEKEFNWESKSGLWKIKVRVDDVDFKGNACFWSHTDVLKFNKRTGRYEVVSVAKTKFSKEVQVAREEAAEFVRTQHMRFIKTITEKVESPFAGLQPTDVVVIHTNDGNDTGDVFFVDQDDETITIENYLYQTKEVIQKKNIVEMYHKNLRRQVYPAE